MEVIGKIVVVLPVRAFTAKRTGSEWSVQEAVIEYGDRYRQRFVFSVFGEDRIRRFGLRQGMEGRLSFDIDGREHEGRWFNTVQAWRFEPIGAAQPPVAAQPPAADDRPF